jgi:hypothetical protein
MANFYWGTFFYLGETCLEKSSESSSEKSFCHEVFGSRCGIVQKKPLRRLSYPIAAKP